MPCGYGMMVGALKLLSIVVPVYNEEPNIGPFYQTVTAALAGLSDRYDLEFIFTDNCSTDALCLCAAFTAEHLGETVLHDNEARYPATAGEARQRQEMSAIGRDAFT